MDRGWVVSLATGETALVQIGIATEGGSGLPVPDLSIEVYGHTVFSRAPPRGRLSSLR
ncbi:VOC family protein [Pseudogemmobacter bohemicus]|uniref:hypothetical protein n=1 Tax=Pseudogemmobacter bohemicus TaxID=2250708 RepID=UPI0018E4EEE0|nr:hypothetical protein [Pseudogemmobacter bohemicus]